MTAKKSLNPDNNPIANDASRSEFSLGSEDLVQSEISFQSADTSGSAASRDKKPPRFQSEKKNGSADTASVILASAALLLPDYGYSRVTIRDLARHSGIGLGTVYGYFRSKEEIGTRLVTRSVEDVHTAMQNILVSPLSPLDCLRSLLIARVSVRQQNTAGQRHPINEATPELAAALTPLRVAWREKEHRFLAEAIALGQSSGQLSPGIAGELAQTMLWATDGLVAEALQPVLPSHPLPGAPRSELPYSLPQDASASPQPSASIDLALVHSEASRSSPSGLIFSSGQDVAGPPVTQRIFSAEMLSADLSSPNPEWLSLKIRRVADLLVGGAPLL